ncbi:MAG: type IX secretion system outer membrane channel protein PorV [Bacteroidota bacterium]
MKRQPIRLAAFILLTSFICNYSFGQADINVVTTAVPFLRINNDARGGGMGETGIAIAPDAYSHFWNAAKTPFIKDKFSGIGVSYTPWLSDLGLNDVYLASLTGFYKLGDDEKSALSAGLRYFSLGSIQFTKDDGTNLQQYRPREFQFDVAYSRKLSTKTSMGVALRYINSDLAYGNLGGVDYKTGSAVAGDITLYHHGLDASGKGLNWGLTLSNLGSKIGYTSDNQNKDYIPANLGVGLAYTTVFDESNKMTFGLDLNKLLVPATPVSSNTGVQTYDDSVNAVNLAGYRNSSVISSWFKSFSDGQNQLSEVQASLGVEYVYDDQFMLRAGYFYEDKNKGDRQYFTAGIGLKYSFMGLNFAYIIPSNSGITRNPLSNTMRFSILFDLEEGGGTAAVATPK